MIKVLIITKILPVPDIPHKKNENDILLVIEDKLKKKYKNFAVEYLFIVPDTNRFLTHLSKKWRAYHKLKRKGKYFLKKSKIHIFGVIQLPKAFQFRNTLYEISFLQKRKIIRKIIEEYQPSIIHAQNTDADAYLARRIKEVFGIPYIVTLRGLSRVADSSVVLNLSGAKRLIALSSVQINDARKLTDKEISLIPHGIPQEFFSKEIPNKNIDELKLISVCRLLKLKNLNLVIIALSTLDHEFTYDIYGEGPEMNNLKELIASYNLTDKVKLKGHIDHKQLPDVLKEHDLFIMPSFPESLGRVYFEAMASGLPVIATKDTGIDGLIENGKEGFFVEPGSLNSLRVVIEHIAKNKKELTIMGRNAQKFAQKYEWDKIIVDIYKAYK